MQGTEASEKVVKWVAATLEDAARVIKTFKVGNAIITPVAMSTIAKLVDTRKVRIALISKDTRQEMGATAAYLRNNVIVIPATISRLSLAELKAVCVHEAAHAINDMCKLKDTKVIDEASAHIVEAMYMISKQIPLPNNRLYKEALNCAEKVLSQGKVSEGSLSLLCREIRIYYEFSVLNAPRTSYDGI